MPTPDQLRQYIADGLECQHLQVTGDGTHFEALVVSAAFEGKRTLERQRMVYAALGDRMREEIHALSMQTRTPAEYGGRAGAVGQHPDLRRQECCPAADGGRLAF